VIDDEVRVAARVVSREFYEARSDYMSTIESFQVKRGDVVKKGQILATTDTTSLKQMLGIYQDYAGLYESQLRIAKNNLRVAEGRRDRLKGLVAKGIIPQSDFDDAEKQALAANGTREQMERALADMRKSANSLLEQIRNANFYSGIDGIVTQLIVDPRSLSGTLGVMSGTLVARVDLPGKYRAEAQLLDTQVHSLKAGMRAEVILPDGSAIDGKVTFVSALPFDRKASDARGGGFGEATTGGADAMTSYKAVIDFERAGEILPAGLLAMARIVTNQYKSSRCVPWNAIEVDAGQAYIDMFTEGKGWARVPVELGRLGRYDVELKSKLPEAAVITSRLW
jgi:multidrug efflux pump subunit AcrA (membrane-fusion protein)